MTTELETEESGYIPECHHHESESRVKLDSLGRAQIVLQCITCGKRMSKDIPTDHLTPAQLEAMPKWDMELQRRFHASDQIAWYEEEEEIRKLRDYGDYLLSDKWKAIRQKVMERAKNTCEGCGVKPADLVHHLTFKRFGNEMLFDLVAICEDCRIKLHAGLPASERAPDPKTSKTQG